MERTKHSLKSGIYQIQSIETNKKYIGRTSDFHMRKWRHLYALTEGIHINKNLQRHVNIYGIRDLVFSIIEYCPVEQIIEKEKYYIELYKPEFNFVFETPRKHNKETCEKISQSLREMYKNPEEKKKRSNAAFAWHKIYGHKTKKEINNKRDLSYYKLEEKEKAKIRGREYRERQKKKKLQKIISSLKEN